MDCIGFALGVVILHCDPPLAPIVPAVPVARFCQEVAAPIAYPASTDERVKRRLRELNARWRNSCEGR